MFPILKASLGAILSNGLAAVLEVDDKDIETQLLGKDGKISFKEVKLREQKIELSNQASNVVCYLIVAASSTIGELDIKWKWSSGTAVATGAVLEDFVVVIKGAKLHISFRYEKKDAKTDEENDNKKGSETKKKKHFRFPKVFRPKSPKKIEPKKKRSYNFTKIFNDEMGCLKRAAIGNFLEAELIQQIIQNVINSFTLQMDDILLDVVVPFSGGASIKMGLKALHFGSVDQKDEFASLSASPAALELILSRLYADLHAPDVRGKSRTTKRTTIMPILEFFSYRATIRRKAGKRFVDLYNGFEVVGREFAVIDKFALLKPSNGIIVHFSEAAMSACNQIVSAIVGGQVSGAKVDYDSEIYNMHKEAPPTEKWPVSTKYILALVGWLFIAVSMYIIKWSLRAMNILTDRKYLTIGIYVVGFLQCLGYASVIVNLDLENTAGKLLKSKDKKKEEKRLKDFPAIFRMPLPFITIVAPDNTQLSLSNFTVLGRVDGAKIHMSASGLDLTTDMSGHRGSRVSMSGLRAVHHNSKTIVNIDRIDRVLVPGQIRVERPLMSSVIVFEEGRLKVKLKSLKVRLLSANEANEEEEDNASERDLVDFDAIAQTVTRTGKIMNEEVQKGLEKLKKTQIHRKVRPVTDPKEVDSRNRMNAEIYESIFKLQLIASIFEQIPVQNNRQNLRLYPNSFRGTEAVAFILENNMASSRQDAVKLIKDIEIEFNLFESVTKEYRFRDDHETLYRFVHPSKRRCWNRSDLPYDFIENFDREPQSSPIPFPICISINKVVLSQASGGEVEQLAVVTKGEVYLDKGKLARAIDATVLVGELKSTMIVLSNARIHGTMDPEFPKLIHRFQVSVDGLQANPNMTTQDWFDMLGLDFIDDSDDEGSSEMAVSKKFEEAAEPYSLPYMVVSDFLLQLSWRGVMIKAKESTMKVQTYLGTDSTTSTDLTKEFVINVLGQAPGMLTNVNVFGINVFQGAGMGAIVNIAPKFIPFGSYIGIAVLATYDGVCGALDEGKAARNDPTGNYKPGDFFRGMVNGGTGLARTGAEIRGKTDEDFYDDEDHIQLDPIDFIVGAGHSTAKYANNNKARFAGAYIAAITMVGTTVVLGPIGGIAAGVVAGAATETAVDYVERRVMGSTATEEDADHDDEEDEYLLGQSHQATSRSHRRNQGRLNL